MSIVRRLPIDRDRNEYDLPLISMPTPNLEELKKEGCGTPKLIKDNKGDFWIYGMSLEGNEILTQLQPIDALLALDFNLKSIHVSQFHDYSEIYDEINSKEGHNHRILPSNQDWLIDRIKTLYPFVCQEGICFGYSHVAKQAWLVQEWDIFIERLLLINNISVDQFSETIEKVKIKIKEKQKLDDKEEEISEILPFFETLLFYHQLYLFPHFFSKEEKPLNQEAEKAIRYVLPNILKEAKITIEKNQSFSGAYSLKELIKYFDSLNSILASTNYPVSLILNSHNHTIFIGYFNGQWTVSNEKNDPWALMDPNFSTGQTFTTSEEIAKQVQFSFSGLKNISDVPPSTSTIFSSEIYTLSIHNNDFNTKFSALKNVEEWQSIHAITKNKAILKGYQNETWLLISVQNNDKELVNSLLKQKADPNQIPIEDDARGLLYIATEQGNEKIVKLLLSHGANVDQVTTTEDTALLMAAYEGYKEIVKLLLKHGANVNHANKNGGAPLFMAASNGHERIVKLLLKHGANVNRATNTHVTPLFMAAQNGHEEIVELLLSHGANPYHAFICTTEGLQDFAKQESSEVQERMQNWISTHSSQEIMHMTPMDIALIMGNQKIVQILNEHLPKVPDEQIIQAKLTNLINTLHKIKLEPKLSGDDNFILTRLIVLLKTTLDNPGKRVQSILNAMIRLKNLPSKGFLEKNKLLEQCIDLLILNFKNVAELDFNYFKNQCLQVSENLLGKNKKDSYPLFFDKNIMERKINEWKAPDKIQKSLEDLKDLFGEESYIDFIRELSQKLGTDKKLEKDL